jgi:hypothetical protein
VERRTTGEFPQRSDRVALSDNDLARVLNELIAAIDRRMPRVERTGEASISQEAAALREKAVQRLSELADHDPSKAV